MTQLEQRQMQLATWLNQLADFRCESLTMVSGDASFRRYFRFNHGDKSFIAVDAPPEYEDSQRFIAVAQRYQREGVRVPAVLAANTSDGFYCLEDFGDRQFAHQIEQGDSESWYQKAFVHLPAIQAVTATEFGPLPHFDETLLSSEAYLFTHWLLEVHLDLTLTPSQQQLMDHALTLLSENFKVQPQVGVHRDFHSRNLMILQNGEVGVIDFQDAVVGPVTYDVVSLLRDCYKVWPPDTVQRLLQHVHQQYHAQYAFADYQRWFDLTGIQRHVKASGIFARLHHRDNKAVYLDSIAPTLNYIVTVGSNYDQLQDFAEFVSDIVLPAVRQRS